MTVCYTERLADDATLWTKVLTSSKRRIRRQEYWLSTPGIASCVRSKRSVAVTYNQHCRRSAPEIPYSYGVPDPPIPYLQTIKYITMVFCTDSCWKLIEFCPVAKLGNFHFRWYVLKIQLRNSSNFVQKLNVLFIWTRNTLFHLFFNDLSEIHWIPQDVIRSVKFF